MKPKANSLSPITLYRCNGELPVLVSVSSMEALSASLICRGRGEAPNNIFGRPTWWLISLGVQTKWGWENWCFKILTTSKVASEANEHKEDDPCDWVIYIGQKTGYGAFWSGFLNCKSFHGATKHKQSVVCEGSRSHLFASLVEVLESFTNKVSRKLLVR